MLPQEWRKESVSEKKASICGSIKKKKELNIG